MITKIHMIVSGWPIKNSWEFVIIMFIVNKRLGFVSKETNGAGSVGT